MKPLRMPTRYGAIALMAAALLPAGAQTYLIDFGGANTTGHAATPNDPVNYWNNIGTAIGGTSSGVLPNLVSSVNATSTLSLVMLSRFNNANENGTQSSLNWPVNATRDSLYGNTESFNGLANIFPRFKLTGLDAASKYAFTFYASRTGATDNREAGYTVSGSNTGYTTLNASANIENTATVTDITPDGTGAITIALAPTANNNNANHFTYLGILKVVVTPPQTPLAFTVQPVSQRVIQLRPATFTAAVTGSPPYSVQWYENGSPMNNETQFTLTLPSVAVWMNGFTYSVSVSNLAYGVLSSNAVLSVLSDTNPPTLVQAVSYDGSSVQLTFSETMDMVTAVDPSNYTVNSGAVQVWSATLNPDSRSVTLTLSAAVAGTFTVVVSNVRDEAGNPIAPSTSLTGSVVPIEEQDVLFDFGASANMTTFGPAPDDPSNHWNNVTATIGTSDTGELVNLVTAHNAAAPITLLMLNRFTGANENGTLFSTVFPTKATQDSLYGNTEVFSGLSNIFPRFKLTGLNPARQYAITFYASRTSVADNRETGYTVTGANAGFTALDAANNLNTTARVAPISPTTAGEVEIALAPTVNNNNANHFTYLGVLKISPYVPPPQFLPPVIQGGQIRLQWTGTGQLLRAPSVQGPWSAVLPTPTSPYSETLVPGENRFYRLQQ